jgi:predicted nucleotidyltransferase component of viral defense system
MEFKVLTDLQADILVALFEEGVGELGYYLTGGTALSEFYLQHRFSGDLDLFTREERSLKKDYEGLLKVLTDHGLEIISSEVNDEFVRCFASSSSKTKEQLKIELARDVPARMSPAIIHGKVVIDSFEDISVNKICAILNREPPEPKDFVDLFFVLENSKYSVEYLLSRAREKEGTLDNEFGIIQFATNLSRVEELHFLPRMIKPFSLETLRLRLVPIAREILDRFRPGGA